jgi:hypothetical protein
MTYEVYFKIFVIVRYDLEIPAFRALQSSVQIRSDLLLPSRIVYV